MSRTEVINLPAIAEQDEWIDGELFRREGEALCPELKSLEYLQQLREDMGPWKWRSMQQGDPTAPEGFEWPAELFGEQIYIPEMPKRLHNLVLYCDPATGEKPQLDRTDYAAVIALGTTGDGNLYFDGILEKVRFEQTKLNIVKLARRMPRHPDLIGIESNGFQKELIRSAVKYFRESGLLCRLEPIENTIKKHIRIRRLDPQVTAGKIRFVNNRFMRLVAQQFMSFPHKHAHDDGPDACDGAVEVMKKAVASGRT